jgi:hypothetical protein
MAIAENSKRIAVVFASNDLTSRKEIDASEFIGSAA